MGSNKLPIIKINLIISYSSMNIVMHCMLIDSCLQTFESTVTQHFFSQKKNSIHITFLLNSTFPIHTLSYFFTPWWKTYFLYLSKEKYYDVLDGYVLMFHTRTKWKNGGCNILYMQHIPTEAEVTRLVR